MEFVLEERATGRRIALSQGTHTVGRDVGDKRVTLNISSPKVSRAHAQLIVAEDSTHLIDLNSTNGTFVDSSRLQARVPVKLSSGSIVMFGDSEFVLQVRPDSQGCTPSQIVDEARSFIQLMWSCPDCRESLFLCAHCHGSGKWRSGSACDFCMGSGNCERCSGFFKLVEPIALLCGQSRHAEAEVVLLDFIDAIALDVSDGNWRPAASLLGPDYLERIEQLTIRYLDVKDTSPAVWQYADLMWAIGFLYYAKGMSRSARDAWTLTLLLQHTHNGARNSLAHIGA